MKYRSKQHFIDRTEGEHATFVELAKAAPPDLLTRPGAWGEDWTIKDLFAHLTQWEQMFLTWHRDGSAGLDPDMPAPGFKWNETPRLNHDIWHKHKDSPWSRIRPDFNASYEEILSLAKSLSEDELLTPGFFAWTTKYPLTTHLGANTACHYAAATKILKRALKQHQ